MPDDLSDIDERRGIQNATSRFKREREAALTSSELLRKSSIDAGETADEEPGGGASNSRTGERLRSRLQAQASILKRELGNIFKKEGIEYEGGDATLLVKDPPIAPPFPVIMVTLALLKDIVDGLDVTGIGIIATTAISFIIALVLFLWLLGKLSGGWWKRKMVRYLWTRYALAVIIELVPVFKIIPATTILVLMAHYRETKIVRVINTALERMRRGGFTDVH